MIGYEYRRMKIWLRYFKNIVIIKVRLWRALLALDLVRLADWLSTDAVEKFAFRYAEMNPRKFEEWSFRNSMERGYLKDLV